MIFIDQLEYPLRFLSNGISDCPSSDNILEEGFLTKSIAPKDSFASDTSLDDVIIWQGVNVNKLVCDGISGFYFSVILLNYNSEVSNCNSKGRNPD